MKTLDKLLPGDEAEVNYGTETIKHDQRHTISTVKVKTQNGETVKKEGIFTQFLCGDLRVAELEVKNFQITNNEPKLVKNKRRIFGIEAKNVDYYEVVNRKTLHVKGEAEVNYKEVGGERTYTSIKESNIKKEIIE